MPGREHLSDRPADPLRRAALLLTAITSGNIVSRTGRYKIFPVVGGLVMSAIKRDRGVKDWGSMIEGHGGMLDRLDSVIFAAPIYFHALRYAWVP